MESSTKLQHYVGQRFGRLVVLEVYKKADANGATARCICDCGAMRIFNLRSVRRGRSRSCGCSSVERMGTGIRRSHGEGDWRHGKRSIEYSIWLDMRWRCRPSNKVARQWYFDRGIRVCERWTRYENFLADMGRRPSGMEIDRIDNDGPYSPDNCRWVTRQDNNANRGVTRYVEFEGEKILLADLAKRLGVSYRSIYHRLVTKPKRNSKKD